MMDTFNALVFSVRSGARIEKECERIGQLALHDTVTWYEPDGTLSLSHAASGHYVWIFEAWVQREDIQRLAHLLSGQDFDGYYNAGCVDKAFVADCKSIFAEWETTVPGRMEHDCISDDQHVAVQP